MCGKPSPLLGVHHTPGIVAGAPVYNFCSQECADKHSSMIAAHRWRQGDAIHHRWRGHPFSSDARLGDGTAAPHSGFSAPYRTGPEMVVARVVNALAAEVASIEPG
jgi:hypothetical protein